MVDFQVVSIERIAKLSINTGRLRISSQDCEEKFVAVCDIGCLILANSMISLTAPVLKECAEHGVTVVAVDNSYHPVSISIPLDFNSLGAKRPHQQAKIINNELSINLWNEIIQSKIYGQATVLQDNQSIYNKLNYIARNIKPDEIKNIEGFAAKIYLENYFNYLNSPIKIRVQQGAEDIVNIMLNYNYTIIRAMVARILAGRGFCLNFGLGHCRKDNAFNLCDDFMEPFRFVGEQIVFDMIINEGLDIEFNSRIKREIVARLFQKIIKLDGKNYRLFHAIDAVVQSYGQVLDNKRKHLLLPNLNN